MSTRKTIVIRVDEQVYSVLDSAKNYNGYKSLNEAIRKLMFMDEMPVQKRNRRVKK